MTVVEQDLQVAPRPAGRYLPRLLDVAERTLIVGAFIWYFVSNLATHSALNPLVAAADSVTVWCVLVRRPVRSISLSPYDWTLAIVGTIGCMLARPGGQPLVGPVTIAILGSIGLGVSLAAKVSLNRSFGVGPANRGVQMRGAYAIVRHPMYLGYAFLSLTYFLLNPTAFNASIMALTWMCQFGRIAREESWLTRDRAYRDYARAVPYRLIPGLI